MALRAAVAALALAALALPAPAAPAPAAATLDLLAGLAGGAPAEVGMTEFTPRGPRHRTLPWADFAALWGNLGPRAAGPGPAGCGAEPLGWWCGPDAGAGADASGRCDTMSAWVAHRAAPGAAYTLRVAGESPGPMLCGGFIVPWSWEVVEMSPLLAPEVLATVLFEGCYAEAWTLHPPGLCPNSFPRLLGAPGDGALDTWLLRWRGAGPGVALSFDLGAYRLDHFAGAPATAGGDVARACYDLPEGFRLEGAAFACP